MWNHVANLQIKEDECHSFYKDEFKDFTIKEFWNSKFQSCNQKTTKPLSYITSFLIFI